MVDTVLIAGCGVLLGGAFGATATYAEMSGARFGVLVRSTALIGVIGLGLLIELGAFGLGFASAYLLSTMVMPGAVLRDHPAYRDVHPARRYWLTAFTAGALSPSRARRPR